ALRITALTLLGLGLVLAVAGFWFVRRPWPQTEGTVEAAGLAAPVKVVRDRWGTPHLYAGSGADLFFAQGYVHAQDRFWQMEFNRRVGRGTLAALVGEPLLGYDRATRNLGLLAAAEGEWKRMDPASRAVLEGYARGVNAYLDGHRGRLALELSLFRDDPAPWTPVDTLLVAKVMYWILSENGSFELSRAHFLARVGEGVVRTLLPPYSEGAPVIVPPEANGYPWARQDVELGFRGLSPLLGVPGPNQGSNNWVVSGQRTATGKPLLANDTHLELFMPSAWYANGLHGGGYDSVGYTLAGTPAVVIGHNKRIAWGVTDLVPDVEDLYLEKLDDPKKPSRYLFQGQWRPLSVHDEVISVKGADPVRMRVVRTHHGPLLNTLGGPMEKAPPTTLAWTGQIGASLVRSLLEINRAGDWGSFRQALSFWDGAHMNFVYADVDGNIGYQAAGRIPIRPRQNTGAVPSPGWTGEYDWQGWIPFAELPTLYNPPAGFVATANQKIVSDDYPYSIGYEYADPYRAIRITDVLARNAKVSVQDSIDLQNDTYHLPAAALRPYLLAVRPADDLEKRALAAVRAWNLRADPQEVGAAIYQVWYRKLVEGLVEDELGKELTAEYMEYYWVHGPVMVSLMQAGTSPLFDDRRTPRVEHREDIAARALTAAVAWLRERYGADPGQWQWGKPHTLTFRQRPLGLSGVPWLEKLVNAGPFPCPGGDRFTVNATWFTEADPEHPFAANAGAAQRMVLDAADWDRSVGVNSTGQSEHLFYRHREDLTPLWLAGKVHPLPYTRAAVDKVAESTLTLSPARGR
ncbi:MAG TPA: penicillin acylase family protein, partial [Thermoanaerobaculia bacterium]|nr:penicillin acylase family protein [Thermoanaerobaculia bacterium]